MSLAFPLLCRKVWFSQFDQCAHSLFKALVDSKRMINANLQECFHLFEMDKILVEKLKHAMSMENSPEGLSIIQGNIYKPFSLSQTECPYLAVEYSDTISGDNVGLSTPINFPLDQVDPHFLFYELRKLKFAFGNSYPLPVHLTSDLLTNEHVHTIFLVATEPYDQSLPSQPPSFFDSLRKVYFQLFALYCKKLEGKEIAVVDTSVKQPSSEGETPLQKEIHRYLGQYNKKEWSSALRSDLNNPEGHTDVLQIDDLCIVIQDKYPKAKFHVLILPRKEIDYLKNLEPEDIPLLEHMREIAESFMIKLRNASPPSACLAGFHAIPSMRQLHMHLISTDFQSPRLKHKKHWNSFTTPFFIPLDTIVNSLKTLGKVEIDEEKYAAFLNTPLRCYHCSMTFRNFPSLSSHLASHS